MSRWRRARVVGTIVVITGVSLAAGQTPGQRPAPPGQVTLPAGGFILGQVVDAGNGQGIAGVTVTLTGGSGPSAIVDERLVAQFEKGLVSAEQLARGGTRRVITDAEGRFLFRDLTRGNYAATATLAGYSPGAFGRRRPEGPSRPLELADNEKVVDATLRLWKLAAIGGTITDEAGEPVVGVAVFALRRYYSGGRQRIGNTMTAMTDDRGIYRIAALTPGDYIVAVPFDVTTFPAVSVDDYRDALANSGGLPVDMLRMRQESGMPALTTGMRVGDLVVQTGIGPNRPVAVHPASSDVRMMVYPTSFYPGARALAQATVMSVGSGEERAGADLVLRPSPATSVSGILSGPEGPAANHGVRLFPADAASFIADTGFEAATAATNAAGRFTFLGVPAGQYTLRAYRMPRGSSVPTPTPAPASMLWAELPVAVGDTPVVDLAVTLRPGAIISGHVVFEGTTVRPTPQQLQAMTVTLSSADGRPPSSAMPPARVDLNGRFTLPGATPGQYLISPSSPTRDWVVKSIMAGGTNVFEQPLVLESSDLGNVVVTYTDRITELSGTVQGIPPNTDEAFSVLIFPADYQSWIANGMVARRMGSATVAKAGTFQVRMPVPGDYLLVARSQDVVGEPTPEYFTALARNATRVSLAEGEKKMISLPLSRAK